MREYWHRSCNHLSTEISSFLRRNVVAVTQKAIGIDVSHYKKTIDWRKVRQSGVDFAIIKATEAEHFADPRFDYNWSRTRREGIIRGAYHFFRPQVDPIAQANHFLKIAGKTLHANDIPPVIDIEMYPDFMHAEWRSISLEERYKRIQLWLQTVEAATGRIPIIYTEYYTWFEMIGDTERFTRYPLWIANYQVEQPKIPANNWGGKSWWMWQYTHKGIVPGIRDEAPCVDMNHFIGSLDDFKKWLKIEGPRSIPPMITNGDMMAAVLDTADQLKISSDKLMTRCDFRYLVDPIGNATRPYDGPAVEELPLEPQERDTLNNFIQQICGENTTAWCITHQDLINAFYYAASLEDIGGWHLVTRAGLDYIGTDRDETYTGPVIDELPELTQNQKDAIIAALGLGEIAACGIEIETQEEALEVEPPIEEESGETEDITQPGVTPTYGKEVDNQAVINAFYLTAIRLDRIGREMMAAAGLSSLVNDRLAVYTGPLVEDMPGLAPDERESIAGLMGVDLGNLVVDSVLNETSESPVKEEPIETPAPPSGPTYPGLVNQDMINLFYKVAAVSGENGWHWVVRCGLGDIGASRETRFESYQGPEVTALASLSSEQRAALESELVQLTAQ
jgi:GH25 family lysozyme M1 (1,4-beta-N-acetylmuramidase)